MGEEPNTYICGSEPTDAVYYSDNLEIVATKQLSFHQGIGDHRTAMMDVSTCSMIGLNEYKIVRPTARKLSSKNAKSKRKYLDKVEEQLGYHRLQHRLDKCETTIQQENRVASI